MPIILGQGAPPSNFLVAFIFSLNMMGTLFFNL
jgi:hypothetical protein